MSLSCVYFIISRCYLRRGVILQSNCQTLNTQTCSTGSSFNRSKNMIYWKRVPRDEDQHEGGRWVMVKITRAWGERFAVWEGMQVFRILFHIVPFPCRICLLTSILLFCVFSRCSCLYFSHVVPLSFAFSFFLFFRIALFLISHFLCFQFFVFTFPTCSCFLLIVIFLVFYFRRSGLVLYSPRQPI